MSEERDYEPREDRRGLFGEELDERYTPELEKKRETIAERLRRHLAGKLGALRRWASYYRRRYEETRATVFKEKLERIQARLAIVERLVAALKRVGWDIYSLAVAETWAAAIRGDLRVHVPDELSGDARRIYMDAVREALRHSTWAGERRTGWTGMVDCDGSVLESLQKTRPSDRACFYAYVELEDEEDYWDQRGRLKRTKVLTVRLFCSRVSDTSWDEVARDAYTAAHRLAEERRMAIGDVCVVLKPGL